jgi:hypothetical protein
MNAQKADSMLICLSDNAVFEFVGAGPPISGRDALRGLAEYDSVLHTGLALRFVRARRDSVIFTGMERNDWLIAAGLPPSEYSSIVFVIQKGRIQAIRAELSGSSAARVNDIMTSLVPWAQQHHPEEYAELVSGDAFAYRADNARRMMLLITEYRQFESSEFPPR